MLGRAILPPSAFPPHGSYGPQLLGQLQPARLRFHTLTSHTLENTLCSCSTAQQQEGDRLTQKALMGQKGLEDAYLSISLRISSSAMLLSCE